MKEDNLFFNDINFWIGPHNILDKFSISEKDVKKILSARFKEYNICNTIISHFLSLFYSPKVGNDALVPILDNFKQLQVKEFNVYGALLLEHESISLENNFEIFLKKSFTKGFRLLRLFPKSHKYPYEKNMLKKFYKICNDFQFPIMISLEEVDITGDKQVDWNELLIIAQSFNNLPLIIDGGNSKSLQFNSYFYLLLQNSSNIYLTTHNLYSFNQIEDLVLKGYAKRLIFDSYFPFAETSVSIQRIIDSDLTNENKKDIASENINRILENINIS